MHLYLQTSTSSMRNNSLSDSTLSKIIVTPFMGKGNFLIGYSNGNME